MKFGKIYYYDRMGNKESKEAHDVTDDSGKRFHRIVSIEVRPSANVEKHIRRIRSRSVNNQPATATAAETADLHHNSRSETSLPMLDTDPNLQVNHALADVDRLGAPDNPAAEMMGNSSAGLQVYISNVLHDGDRCATCQLREVQSMTAASKKNKAGRISLQEQAAINNYLLKQKLERIRQDNETSTKAEELQEKLYDFNSEVLYDQAYFNRNPGDSGSYVFYKRPDTPDLSSKYQEQVRQFQEEFSKQLEARHNHSELQREEDAADSNKQLSYNQQSYEDELTSAMTYDQKNKEEYSRALMDQIVNKQEEADIPWWTRRAPFVETLPARFVAIKDQNIRLDKQAKAYHNLKQFMADEQRQKEDVMQERKLRRDSVEHSMGFYENRRRTRTPETQRRVEEMWQQAHDESDKKREVLQHNYGSSILDNMRRQPARCRTCHKLLSQHHPEQQQENNHAADPLFWYDSGTLTLNSPTFAFTGVPHKSRYFSPVCTPTQLSF